MGYLDQLLVGIDNTKRVVGRNVSDMVDDPSLYAEKIVGALRNRNAGVVPVAAGGELANRPLTREEIASGYIDNFAGAGIIKARPPTVFEQRHLVAQRNAALPVEQGGLGLGPQNTAMERAKAMGFEDAYHGATTPIEQIDQSKAGGRLSSNPSSHLGFFSTPNAKEASRYATDFGGKGGNVMPLMVRRGNSFDMPNKQFDDISMGEFYAKGATPQERYSSAVNDVMALKNSLASEGYDSITRFNGRPMEEFISMNPTNVRSRFAAFDPMRRHEADMLGFANPQLLGGMALGSGGILAAPAIVEALREKK